MAKKLVYNYTFTPGTSGVGNLVIYGYYPLKTLLLVTNVTDSQIIFSFADPSYSGSVNYDEVDDKTTIIFNYDTSSMDASDEIQIFVDEQEPKIDFSETFVDPVSKFRVSNPQNLIDTDFEYGLQPIKWETVELVNNIPSFYSRDTQYTILDIASVIGTNNSASITVVTSKPHGLSVGIPIEVQGLKNPTAEGKYIITAVPAPNSFTYVAKEKQVFTASDILSTAYTEVRVGEFFVGSDVDYEVSDGIVTDSRANSTLTFKTNHQHGFKPGSNFYVTNTVGAKRFDLEYVTSDNAIDGRPNIDFQDAVEKSVNIDLGLTETAQMTGTYALKFDVTSVNTTDNTIEWPAHGLKVGDALLYVSPFDDTAIGGLNEFQIYYVKSVPTLNTITLCETTNGDYTNNSTINFTSTGTFNYGRHKLILAYEYRFIKSGSNIALKTRNSATGSGSGWDRRSNSGIFPYGLSERKADRTKFIIKDYDIFTNHNVLVNTLFDNRSVYDQYRYDSYTLGDLSEPSNFILDFRRFNRPHPLDSSVSTSETNYGSDDDYIYFNRYSQYNKEITFPYGRVFSVDLDFDPEGDSIYVGNHGFPVGTAVTAFFDKTSGTGEAATRTEYPLSEDQAATYQRYNGDITANVSIISEDRIRLIELPRLARFNATYNATLYTENNLRDSFFVSGLDGISPSQKLFVSTSGSAALPTTASGASIPESGTVQAVYNAVNRALLGIRELTLNSIAGQDLRTYLVYNNNQEHYPFIDSDITVDGGIQRLGWARSKLTVSGFSQGLIYPTWSVTSKDFSQLTGWANGVYFDPFDTTELANKGWYMCVSPFTGKNTFTPYFISVKQIPRYTDLNPLAETYSFYWSERNVEKFPPDAPIFTSNGNNQASNWFDVNGSQAGLGWKYTYEFKFYGTSSTRHGYIFLHILISNTNWPQYKPFNPAFNLTPNHPFDTVDAATGQAYKISCVIPLKNNGNSSTVNGTIYPGDVSFVQQLVNDITNEIADTLKYPQFESVGITTVRARIVPPNRLKLNTDDGVLYNYTDSGNTLIGQPISIETELKSGGADGYYSTYAVSDNKVRMSTDTKIDKRKITWDFGSVTSSGIAVTNHKMANNTLVLYNEIGGGSISGLTSGSAYYVKVNGPDFFGLKTFKNSDDVITLTPPGSGSFKITLDSISGISSIPGTVAFSTESNLITGTDTDFSRYFKSGDEIKVDDVTTTPKSYVDLKIDSVLDDNNIIVNRSVGIASDSSLAYTQTKINVRPDGTSIHRPFDGGVEITAGSSPDSSIVRQTRKYFRYQSGKGIQCSFAINFNPPRPIISMNGSRGAILNKSQNNIINLRNRESSSSVASGYLYVQNGGIGINGLGAKFAVSGEVIDNGEYYTVPLTFVTGSLTDGQNYEVNFTTSGTSTVGAGFTYTYNTIQEKGTSGDGDLRFNANADDADLVREMYINVKNIYGENTTSQLFGGIYSYILFGEDRNGNVLSDNAKITVYEHDKLDLNIATPGQPVWIKTSPVIGTGNPVSSTYAPINGIDEGTISFDPSIGAGTYYYQSENQTAMNGEIEVVATPDASTSETLVRFTTLTPHGLVRGNKVRIRGANDNAYDGIHEILAVDNEEAYYISTTTSSVSTVVSSELDYTIEEWENSAVRCGLFDFQNGFFFEFDGKDLYAVRRSSTLQLPLRANVTSGSHYVNWSAGSKFTGKLQISDFIVIRGISYKVTKVEDNQLNIQPAYRGVSDTDVVITKTVDTKVAQKDWNIDKADGKGPSGFKLDTTKIQMAYLDYSWYGAGKIRFGFKDTYGHVKYFHQFIHNNLLDESYMRSGNIPSRYEITNFNGTVPSYIPSLFHWGTSIIMDGTFDDDKTYKFTASSNKLIFSNGDYDTVNTTADSDVYYRVVNGKRKWYLRIFVAQTDLSKFVSGTPLYTIDRQLEGQSVSNTGFSGNQAYVDIFLDETNISQNLDITPSILNATAVYTYSAPYIDQTTQEINSDIKIPVVSIRIAPSADNNLSGPVGVRDIINRMQLQLKSLGITLTHDCEIDLILNGSLNNLNFQKVDTPSLSELIAHEPGDRVTGGSKVFSFRASGADENASGVKIGTLTTDFDLSNIIDLGNCILGGDGIYPNGPDLLTIAISPTDTSNINSDSPLKIFTKITWTESQA